MAEFAYEPEPELKLAPGESVREISGRSPWRIAGRRLVRNRLAMAALGLFLLIVVVCFLAPVYANDVADTDPFVSNISGTTVVDGKRVGVLQQGGGGLGLGEVPLGPTWQTNYFLGADNQGRDVMARVIETEAWHARLLNGSDYPLPGVVPLFSLRNLVKEGVLENPKVDAIFGLPVMPYPAGTVTYRPGPMLASADAFLITIKGKQTHGAAPWGGIDPIECAQE